MRSPIPGAELPTRGILSFGYERSPTHTHQGIDLHAPIGKPIEAVSSGTVEHAYWNLAPGFSGYGRVVVIRTDKGPWELYSHMDQIYVTKGEQVGAGQVIGTVGRTCFNRSNPHKLCNRPHVHFEVSPRPYPQGSEEPRMDPVAWISNAGGGIGLLALLGLGGAGWFAWRKWFR